MIVEQNPKIADGNEIIGLGVNQFQNVVQLRRHINAASDPDQGVHLVDATLQVGDHLGTFYVDGCLFAQARDKVQVLVGILGG